MHLNFLPEHQIAHALDVLLQEESGLTIESEKKGFQKLKKYIRVYWIDRVGPSVLSVFGLCRKTNNGAETHHGRLKSRVLSHRPRLWRFLEIFNQMMVDYSNDIGRLENGIPISRQRRSINIANSERRQIAEEKLTSGTQQIIRL